MTGKVRILGRKRAFDWAEIDGQVFSWDQMEETALRKVEAAARSLAGKTHVSDGDQVEIREALAALDSLYKETK